MDPELKVALDEIKQEMAAMRQENAQRSTTIEERMATKDDLEALRAEIRDGDEETRRHVDAHGRDIRDRLTAMETRLTNSIKERLTDDRTQYDEIEKLKVRVKRLETQVKTLVGTGGEKQ